MNTSFSDSASPATACHVTREANLIARNLECLGARVAATRTAEHIGRFWAPQLRATLFEQARNHPERFGPITGEAIAMLRESSA